MKKLFPTLTLILFVFLAASVSAQAVEDQAAEKCYKTGWYWNGWMLWYGKHEVPCLDPSPTGPPSEDIEEDVQ